MEKYLLGIDIGTSSCKVAIFKKNGEVVSTATREYPVQYPKENWVEQNPNDWWNAICICINEVINESGTNSKDIVGIGVDGQSWSAIPIDENGNVLANTPIWLDTRASEICEKINNEVGEDNIFQLSGNLLQPSYTTAKIIWFKENMPEVYNKTKYILQSNSYIVYKLTGEVSQDVSQGYGIHCFDMKNACWDKKMAEKLGISIDMLPKIYSCHDIVGVVREDVAKITGLAIGTPVVAGGLDAACGTLGAGVINKGDVQEQGGQAGGMSICMEDYKADKRLILGFHVVPNRWLLQGGTTGGGGVMRWLEKEFGSYEKLEAEKAETSALNIFNDLANNVNVGSDGLVFLPYMLGERSPIWNPNAKGVYFGLDFSKTKGHFIRAAMEGVAFSLKHNIEIAEEIGTEVKLLKATGGSANSILWTQIKADITGKDIVVPSSDTSTTLGAAILAGVGVGLYVDFEDAINETIIEKRKHLSNFDNRDIYDMNYRKYRELYENLKEMM